MRKSKYSESQIMAILKQNEGGFSVPDLCREHGMSSAQFCNRRSKYGGMDASMMKRMKELEAEKEPHQLYQPKNDVPQFFDVFHSVFYPLIIRGLRAP